MVALFSVGKSDRWNSKLAIAVGEVSVTGLYWLNRQVGSGSLNNKNNSEG